jgi:hypothetical protein
LGTENFELANFSDTNEPHKRKKKKKTPCDLQPGRAIALFLEGNSV